eukprot:scaffold307904_cov15-Tisochrysis_lutea.AAC.2
MVCTHKRQACSAVLQRQQEDPDIWVVLEAGHGIPGAALCAAPRLVERHVSQAVDLQRAAHLRAPNAKCKATSQMIVITVTQHVPQASTFMAHGPPESVKSKLHSQMTVTFLQLQAEAGCACTDHALSFQE